jgi:hypothetical protein
MKVVDMTRCGFVGSAAPPPTKEEGGVMVVSLGGYERKKKAPTRPPPKMKRVVTKTEQWQHVTEHQDDLLPTWLQGGGAGADARLVHQQIQAKLSGYRCQDQQKNLFNPEKFVALADVLALLTSLTCYYCRNPVLVIYDFVREPRQWTLERLDNDCGHNRDNVVLSCLQCNIRRRTMLSERYIKTHEMKRIVKLD